MEKDAEELLKAGATQFGAHLTDRELGDFSLYMELLQRWGRKINLTARLTDREVVTIHFLDSLAALPLLKRSPGESILDAGAGAGFPSLPLRILLSGTRFTLLEGSRKKISFCREVVRRLGLKGVDLLQDRAERLGGREPHREGYDWVLSRAMAQTGDALRLCLPFLAPGGRLVLYKGPLDGKERAQIASETLLRHCALEILPVNIPFLEAERTLVVVTRRST